MRSSICAFNEHPPLDGDHKVLVCVLSLILPSPCFLPSVASTLYHRLQAFTDAPLGIANIAIAIAIYYLYCTFCIVLSHHRCPSDSGCVRCPKSPAQPFLGLLANLRAPST